MCIAVRQVQRKIAQLCLNDRDKVDVPQTFYHFLKVEVAIKLTLMEVSYLLRSRHLEL